MKKITFINLHTVHYNIVSKVLYMNLNNQKKNKIPEYINYNIVGIADIGFLGLIIFK